MAKAILKEPKIYFFDAGRVRAGSAARLENIVACHLLKELHFREDTEGVTGRLHYLRDKEKREVDFAVVEDDKIRLLVEVKESDTALSSHLRYFSDRLFVTRAVQAVRNTDREFNHAGIKVSSAASFLAELST